MFSTCRAVTPLCCAGVIECDLVFKAGKGNGNLYEHRNTRACAARSSYLPGGEQVGECVQMHALVV